MFWDSKEVAALGAIWSYSRNFVVLEGMRLIQIYILQRSTEVNNDTKYGYSTNLIFLSLLADRGRTKIARQTASVLVFSVPCTIPFDTRMSATACHYQLAIPRPRSFAGLAIRHNIMHHPLKTLGKK